MNTNGPEYRQGWRQHIDVEGVRFLVEARHYPRRRLPRGHELARMAARGRPFDMVDDPQHEWCLTGPGLRPAVIRPLPNGSFTIEGRFVRERDLVNAVTRWLEKRFDRQNDDRPGGMKP